LHQWEVINNHKSRKEKNGGWSCSSSGRNKVLSSSPITTKNKGRKKKKWREKVLRIACRTMCAIGWGPWEQK
jgi:hypothetical protein